MRIGPKEQGRTGSFTGELPAADLAALRADPRRAEGLLEARRLERPTASTSPPAARRATPKRSGSAGRSSTPSASPPLRGRLLGPSDDQPGCPSPSVVVSEPLLAARARRAGALARRDARARGTPVRDRGHHARAILRHRGRPRVRRRAAHLRRRPPRGQAPDEGALGLVALGRRPARSGLDAREGQRAPGRHLEGDLRGVAAGELRRRRREAVPRA